MSRVAIKNDFEPEGQVKGEGQILSEEGNFSDPTRRFIEGGSEIAPSDHVKSVLENEISLIRNTLVPRLPVNARLLCGEKITRI